MRDDDLMRSWSNRPRTWRTRAAYRIAHIWPEVRQLVREARQEYRDIGAPLGDTDEGFLAWVKPRPQPPTA